MKIIMTFTIDYLKKQGIKDLVNFELNGNKYRYCGESQNIEDAFDYEQIEGDLVGKG